MYLARKIFRDTEYFHIDYSSVDGKCMLSDNQMHIHTLL